MIPGTKNFNLIHFFSSVLSTKLVFLVQNNFDIIINFNRFYHITRFKTSIFFGLLTRKSSSGLSIVSICTPSFLDIPTD